MFIYNTGAVSFRDAQFGPGIGPIFLENLICSGSETTLMECRHSTPLGLSTCAHSQDAGVRCVGKAPAKPILSMDFYLVVILVSLYFQTSMSVTLSMEVVNRPVPMLLVALPAAVL